MLSKTFFASCIIVFLSLQICAQETINAMFYNLLEFPEAPPSNRADILKVILDNYQPDLFMVCELQSENGANSILNTSLKTADNRFAKADFVANQSTTDANLQQLVFYNTKKLVLENQDEIVTNVRDINHYTFKLNTSTSIFLEVFIAHLKSSQGTENEQQRLEMVLDFTSYLSSIPASHYVLFAGDFNFYTSNEDGYQELLDPTNSIVLKDPINRPGSWNNSISYQDIHTQSTRTSNSNFEGFGAGGGLDDRFDFILISENLQNNTALQFIENSYKSFGNNGNCFNKNINDSSCTGVEFSQAIRNALYNMSDHLPVVMQLKTDQVLNTDEALFSNVLIQFKKGNTITDSIELLLDSRILNENIDIYNSLGQKVISTPIYNASMFINATHLTKGIYYLSLRGSKDNALKFIKV